MTSTITSSGLTPSTSLLSLSTLLSTHLPSVSDISAPQAPPLIISPALPPIPAKEVEKAQKDAFVDFKNFLADNSLLIQQIQELSQARAIPAAAQPLLSSSRMREPLTWASCFLAYMAAKTQHEQTRHLAAYGMIILQPVRKHSRSGWLLYDRQFHLQQAAGACLPWVEINPSLLAVTVLNQPSERFHHSCHLCLAADHTREDCALASLEFQRSPPTSSTNRLANPTRAP